ncbi:hypothetical protein ABOM_004854 [Aspergillus bombycis]|uniref:Uncharacterized protein n=1 Tax=Aspergillus bombycis TaxID=109264 RepID=A0A1F8A3C6_9EURO|nr:hypothetical protein ABOM_004854 [Aspergillus bombycis]OGM46232.1 hypothetical protein ABOM_004854 [Aspergillus bombycis]
MPQGWIRRRQTSARSLHGLLPQLPVLMFAQGHSMISTPGSKWAVKDPEATNVAPQIGEMMFITALGCARQDTRLAHCQHPNNALRQQPCAARSHCTRPLNTRIPLTMSGATHTTTRTAYAITATPIQIRFRAAESTVVPIPTASLRLPRGYLYKREKVGIGIGVSAAVIGFAIGIYFCCCSGRKQQKARVPTTPLGNYSTIDTPDVPPPAYPGRDDGLGTGPSVPGGSPEDWHQGGRK